MLRPRGTVMRVREARPPPTIRTVPDLLVVLIVILVLVLLWRGPKTLPRLGEALGRGVREARTQASEATSDADERRDNDATTPAGSSSVDGDRRP